MEKLYERDIAQAYIGKPCNLERYTEIFNKANIFYCGQCDIKTKWKFNITPSLYIGWEQRNVDFRIVVFVSAEGIITHCAIDKRKDNYAGLYVRNACIDLKPTQQELRLFKRVLEYIHTK